MSDVEKRNILDFLRELEDRGVRGELSVEDLVRRQMERCNIAATYPDPSVFEASVNILRTWLPRQKKAELDRRAEEYTEIIEGWRYRDCCGVPMGTPEKPVIDREGRIISPIEVKDEEVNYKLMYEVILELFEGAGLTWKVESMTAEIGRVKEKTEFPPATPDFIGEKRDEEWRKKRGQTVRVA